MNILTKISVVVLLVLVLLYTGVSITSSVIPQNYRHAWEQEVAKRTLAEQTTVNSQLALQEARAQLNKSTSELAALQASTTKSVADLTAENGKLKADNAALAVQITGINDRLMELTNSLKLEQQQREAAEKTLAATREDLDKVNKENQALIIQVQQKDGNIKRLELADRQNRVTIADMEEQNKKLQDQLEGKGIPTASETSKELAALPASKISGQVTAVQGEVVSVNVGSAKGLKSGMTMILFRGDQFVAHVRLQEVEVGQAAGVIYDKRLDPQQGDSATTSLK